MLSCIVLYSILPSSFLLYSIILLDSLLNILFLPFFLLYIFTQPKPVLVLSILFYS